LKQNYGLGEENGEHHFGNIELDKLKIFYLIKSDGKKQFGVNVKESYVFIGDTKFIIEFKRSSDNLVVNPKLIFFRRNKIDFNQNGRKEEIRYCIGLQANIDGINYQQYIFINPDRTFTLSQFK
jgi:hypothetical protein